MVDVRCHLSQLRTFHKILLQQFKILIAQLGFQRILTINFLHKLLIFRYLFIIELGQHIGLGNQLFGRCQQILCIFRQGGIGLTDMDGTDQIRIRLPRFADFPNITG